MSYNPAIPRDSLLFNLVQDDYGDRLALVFGNERNECPFYATRCKFCDIGMGEGTIFTPEMNTERLKFFQKYYVDILQEIDHLILYNSGSTLNPKELSRKSLARILRYASSLDKCSVVSLDSREHFIQKDSLDFVLSCLREDQQSRVILGFETQDDFVRNEVLKKGMKREDVERVFTLISKYSGRVGLDLNVIFSPPTMQGQLAIPEVVRTLEWGLELGAKYSVPVDFNIHPFYVSTKSKRFFPEAKSCDRTQLDVALVEMKQLLQETHSHLFLGLETEGHDKVKNE